MSDKNKALVSLIVPKISMGAALSSLKKVTRPVEDEGDDSDCSAVSAVSRTSSLLSIPTAGTEEEVSPVAGPSGSGRSGGSTAKNDGRGQSGSKVTRPVAMKRTNPRPGEVVPAKRRAPRPPSPSTPSPTKSRRSLSPSPASASPTVGTSHSLFEALLVRNNEIKDEDNISVDKNDADSHVSSTYVTPKHYDSGDDDDDDDMFEAITVNKPSPISPGKRTPVKKTATRKPGPKRGGGRGRGGRKRNATTKSSVASLTPKKKLGSGGDPRTKQQYLDLLSSSSSNRSASVSPSKDTSLYGRDLRSLSASSTEDLFEPITMSTDKVKEIIKKKSAFVLLEQLADSEIRRRTARPDAQKSSREVKSNASEELPIPGPDPSAVDENSVILEVCVDNVASLKNAATGGANRIELCSALSEGGLTPTPGLLKYAKLNLKIPVFCMIRPRAGDFVYSDDDLKVMEEDLKALKKLGADGFVFGALNEDAEVDERICERLINLATPLPCTFHRAFDHTAKPHNSLERIVSLGFSRILTSGQKPSAIEGWMTLRLLVNKAAGRIVILAGAGVKSDNVKTLIEKTRVREVHGSAREKISSVMKSEHLLASGSSAATMGKSPTEDNSHYVSDADEVAKILLNANANKVTLQTSLSQASSN